MPEWHAADADAATSSLTFESTLDATQPRTARKPGMIAVDGELWALEKTKVEVLPSKLTLLGAAAGEARAV